MKNFYIFLIRAVMGAAFSVVLIRMFNKNATFLHIGGLAVFLVGAAYFFEFWRQRNSKS